MSLARISLNDFLATFTQSSLERSPIARNLPDLRQISVSDSIAQTAHGQQLSQILSVFLL
jgi:hypothetical protein